MKALHLSPRERRQLEMQLKSSRDARVYRRTLAILEYDRGRSVTEIARTLRVSRPSIYHWIERYRESSDPESLFDEDRSGRPPAWTEECSEWLQSFLNRSPAELGYYAVNWTVPLLRDPLEMCVGKQFSDHTIRRALGRLDYVWKRPRYVLAPDPEREKKNAEFAAESGVCRLAACCWWKTRPICFSFPRCAPTGADVANQPVFSFRVGTLVVSSSVR